MTPPVEISRGLQVFAVACALAASPPASGATGSLTNPLPEPLPSGISVEVTPWLTIPASSTGSPKARISHLKPCPGDTRLFCNDLRGKLWVIAGPTATSAATFLNLADHFPDFIPTPGLGTGFASFAFHPEFQQAGAPGRGKFYTAHSERENGPAPDFSAPDDDTDLSQIGIVTEWTMVQPTANGLTLSPTNFTRREILRFGFPFNYHDLQEIAFDPTAAPGHPNYGCLFICLGDGGSVVLDRPDLIGRIDSPLGGIFRITPVLATGHQAAHFTLSANGRYYIPSGPANANPWVNTGDPSPGDGHPVVRELYALGFRNPHRITWDSATGKMFCGNIGESMIEEVELVEKGSHHGWPAREGSFRFDIADKTHVYPLPAPETGGYRYPVLQYDHGNGRAAITGGLVYRGAAIPALQGQYLCGDIVSGDLFVAPASSLNPAATTDTGSAPALPKTLGVKSGGVTTSFRSILGTTRADLRFGTDHSGEIFLLSKQNGTIYRVTANDPGLPVPPAGIASDWSALGDFESGSLGGMTVSVPGSSAQVVNDPAEGPVNRVLRIRSAGSSTLTARLPIPPIPDGGFGTVFFRFYLVDQNHDANWGLSEQTSPSTSTHFKVQMRSTSTAPGVVQVKDAASFASAADVQPRTWYSAWLQVRNGSGTTHDLFDVYLQGGSYGVPTLVKTGVRFTAGTSSSLKTFFWRFGPTTEVYFDDLHVDVGHANLSDPVAPDWRLVDHFEGPAPLAAWDIPSPAAQSATIVTEPSGNRYLRRAASSSAAANPKAIAARRLPFDTQVSQSLTLFFRLRLEGGNLLHHFGASSAAPSNPADFSEDDFAPQLRLSPPGQLHLFDGPAGSQDFVAAPVPALESNEWYKVWIVAENRGAASGGQVWQAYLKGGAHDEIIPLGDRLHFRDQAELPITRFLTIASSGAGIGNQAVHLDDIHAFEGVNLSDPLAPTWTSTTLERSGNDLTLRHPTGLNRAFQLFESGDLHDWQPLGPPVEGDAAWREMTVPLVHSRRFFQAAELSRRDFHADSWTTDFPGTTLPAGLSLLSSSTWTKTAGLLTLNTTAAQVSGMVARPGGYALIPGDWRNTTLTVEARTLRSDSTTNRDICLIFGYVDETHFYYAHVSSASDGTAHTVIMKVDGSVRTTLHAPATPPAKLTSSWHTLRVTHSATGQIAVFADNLVTPFMTANDTAFPVGRAGFGSYDDPAEFRRVTVTGERP
jgi:hypothetical protein